MGAWQYGKDYDYDAPVKLLDKLLHSMSQSDDEQLLVVSQVLHLAAGMSSFDLSVVCFLCLGFGYFVDCGALH